MHLLLKSAVLALLLCESVGVAMAQAPAPTTPPGATCPNLSGHWGSGGGLAMVLTQQGCDLSSTEFEDGGWRYHVTGHWTGYGFNWIMTRTAKGDGCESRLMGMAVSVEPDVIHSAILRTEGHCDLAPTYGEVRDWDRQKLEWR